MISKKYITYLANPHTGIIELLVRFVIAFRIPDLSLQIVTIFRFKCPQSVPVGPLCISINIHLNDTILDCRGNFFIGRSTTAMHDQENGLVRVGTNLVLDECLMLTKTLRLQTHVAWEKEGNFNVSLALDC
jgi:hypothetical protein